MAVVMEKFHKRKLDKYKVETKTKYKSGDNILYINSNGVDCDDVKDGIILEKSYYKNNVLLKKLYNFDSRVVYSFVLGDGINDKSTCPNCGYEDKVKNFIDGCPYCGTNYNIDYLDKKLGNKEYYDRIIHSNFYKVVTLVIDLIISFLISYIYIFSTSRTFNVFDISKIVVFGLVLGLFLYYVFYYIDAYVVLLPIKIYKDRQNDKQIKFWEKMNSLGIDKKSFFNNFNYELQRYYFDNENNIIDYDIVDYLNFDEFVNDKKIEVDVVVRIRLVRFIRDRIKVRNENVNFKLRKIEADVSKLKELVNIIDCPGCGHSLDVVEKSCNYCGTKFNYLQEWYLVKK